MQRSTKLARPARSAPNMLRMAALPVVDTLWLESSSSQAFDTGRSFFRSSTARLEAVMFAVCCVAGATLPTATASTAASSAAMLSWSFAVISRSSRNSRKGMPYVTFCPRAWTSCATKLYIDSASEASTSRNPMIFAQVSGFTFCSRSKFSSAHCCSIATASASSSSESSSPPASSTSSVAKM